MEIQLDLFEQFDAFDENMKLHKKASKEMEALRRGVFTRVDAVHKELDYYKDLVEKLSIKVDRLEAKIK